MRLQMGLGNLVIGEGVKFGIQDADVASGGDGGDPRPETMDPKPLI